MAVVSDSSPLINLYLIGRFSVLTKLYSSLYIPEAVWKEITETTKEGATFFKQQKEKGFLKVITIPSSSLLRLLLLQLDNGEAEAIALAVEKKALLLLDEKEGREAARQCGLQVAGVIGILMKAKKEGLIQAIKPELIALQEKRFWIRQELFENIIKLENEY